MEYYTDDFAANKTILCFKYNSLYEEFLTKNKDTLEKIKKELRRLSVSSDFETKYEIISELGEGTFAKVHKVTEKSTKNEYAIKVYKLKELDEDPEIDMVLIKACLKDEIKIMRAFRFVDSANLVLFFFFI